MLNNDPDILNRSIWHKVQQKCYKHFRPGGHEPKTHISLFEEPFSGFQLTFSMHQDPGMEAALARLTMLCCLLLGLL